MNHHKTMDHWVANYEKENFLTGTIDEPRKSFEPPTAKTVTALMSSTFRSKRLASGASMS